MVTQPKTFPPKIVRNPVQPSRFSRLSRVWGLLSMMGFPGIQLLPEGFRIHYYS